MSSTEMRSIISYHKSIIWLIQIKKILIKHRGRSQYEVEIEKRTLSQNSVQCINRWKSS